MNLILNNNSKLFTAATMLGFKPLHAKFTKTILIEVSNLPELLKGSSIHRIWLGVIRGERVKTNNYPIVQNVVRYRIASNLVTSLDEAVKSFINYVEAQLA
jgi:hypothetical protein